MPNVEKVRGADLSAALEYLPAELRPEAKERIRDALRFYLISADFEHEPPRSEQAKRFRDIEATTRKLAGLLLLQDEPNPKLWPARGGPSTPILSRLCITTATERERTLHWTAVPTLMTLLARLCESAKDCAERSAADLKPGPPPAGPIPILLDQLRPLWAAIKGKSEQARFVEACLAAIGESHGESALRSAIRNLGKMRVGQNELAQP